ncbi:NitT/TauT family transport system permease protein [Ancylobacter sp. 3268]|uniref:ABC transporter permease n=1 Tax=Ancylobacter sp. 3268 TaxID=2817752 RepID=UPI00285CDB93|nr:ABC transporter permease [Ancylobacter sp. 3268]MDR6953400.1 NitT/TauT family transport system permease protein [Ancylobacter sp. 3268]
MSIIATDEDRGSSVGISAARLSAGFRTLRGLAWKSASLIAVFALWEALPRLGLVDRVWFPPFTQVLGVIVQMLRSGELQNHIAGSLIRSLIGFGLAVSLAVPLGLVIGWYARVRDFLTSALEFFRNTSALALLPVFILFLGIGEASKIGIVTFACFFPILLNTISGVKSVDPLLIKSARSLALPAPSIFTKIILPSAVPSVFTGFRLAAQSSILVLIAAEMVGATRGLGYLINYAQFNFLIPKMYAGILTIALIGLAVNQLLVTAERRLSRWRVPTSNA